MSAVSDARKGDLCAFTDAEGYWLVGTVHRQSGGIVAEVVLPDASVHSLPIGTYHPRLIASPEMVDVKAAVKAVAGRRFDSSAHVAAALQGYKR